MSTASEQVEQLEEAQPGAQPTAQPSEPSEPSDLPITWTHSVPDYASTFEVGPWTAIVSDPIETPPAIRLAGRYIVRGFLRHTGGRSLSRDFGANTSEEATLKATRWAEGSVHMWLKALQSVAGNGDLSILPRLPPASQQALVKATFDSLRVSVAKGHLPRDTPVGIDAMQPKSQPAVSNPDRRRRRRKRRQKRQ